MEGHDTLSQPDSRAMGLPPGSGQDKALPESILKNVTQELIARLSKKLPDEADAQDSLLPPAPKAELEAFCDALVAPDPALAGRFFDRLREQGKTPDTLSLRWISGAACMLGERWTNDTCSFLDVTLGVSRLHGLQRGLQGAFVPGSFYQPPELTALFAPVPGETHVLGISIAADFFRRASWHVDLHFSPDLDALLARAMSGDYRLIGLSAGSGSTRKELVTTVECLRDALPGVKIVLGGVITVLEPNIKEQVRVDHVFSEGVSAPLVCKELVYPETEVLGGAGP